MTTVSNAPPDTRTGPRRPRSAAWKWMIFLLVVALGAGAAAYFSGVSRERAVEVVRSWTGTEARAKEGPGAATSPGGPPPKAEPWDGLVTLSPDEEQTVGFAYAVVKSQSDPLTLPLTGRTAYDPTTLTKIRPRFDTRVEKVFATVGQKVKKGDPLVDLYSTDLAAAKSDFQTKYVQWQHDLKLYQLRQKLVQTGAISQQLWVDTQNDEQKSRLEFNLALDKLSVYYEVRKEEIDPLLERLGDNAVDPRHFGTITEKAKMTLLAKQDGIVIEREVVPGNYYESTDVLMVIAPLDHLWVLVNVYELDQEKVSVGQTLEIRFPYLTQQKLQGRVDYVASEVSKDTRAVKIRASIPNPDAKLKSDMLVNAMLDIPPLPGQTSVPRLAMVTFSGDKYVFVRKKPPARADEAKEKQVDKFERRAIEVAQENTDFVIVTRGLKPGEEVVTNGSLILSQLYEDQRATSTGLPAE